MRKMGIGLGVGINRSNYAQGIFNAYSARVVADGGVVESGTCVDAVSGILLNASLLLIPSGYKSGKAYAEIPTNGNGDLTWTRGGDAFRTNASGVLQRVPWNLLQYSEDFTNAVWGKTNVTVSGNTTTAPNGTTTADTLTTTATTGRHLLLYGDHSATTITASIYVKKNTHNFFQIFTGWAGVAYANYDINNGVVGDVGSGTVASITNVGNGWYRCSFTSPAASASTIRWNLVTSLTAVYNESWTANGTESVFIWGAQLVEGTTAQTYLPTTDRLNFPRLSYMYGSCPSALLEPQRTNLALYSQDFGNALWVKQGATVTTDQTTSPDGTTNADVFATSNVLSFHRVYENITINATTLYSYSVFVKSNTSTLIQIALNTGFASSASSAPYANFNLSTGAVSQSGNGATASIINANNGWYRCVISATSLSGAIVGESNIVLINSTTAPPFQSWQGTGAESVYIYGAQLEAGAYPTTYIPTTSATATRVADSFSRNNIYTNGLISASGGTWFVELRGNVVYTRDSASGLEIANSGFTQRIILFNAGGNSRLIVFLTTAGTVYTTTTDTVKLAIKWNGSTASVFANGTKVANNVTFTGLNMENLIGGQGVPFFIQQMALFPTPLSDTDCTTLTT